MNDFKIGDVANGALESGILIAADDEGVYVVRRHGGADVGIAAVDFTLRRHDEVAVS